MENVHEIRTQFPIIGRRIFSEHLVGGNFGNLSARADPEGFFITHTGSYLDEPGEPVYVPLQGEVPPTASSEWRVHRSVYLKSDIQALVHAHPPYAVAASLMLDTVIPEDSEGKMFCPEIPVITGEPGTQDLADRVAEALRQAPICIARGHGTFASGKTLEQAFLYTSLTEHACRVLSFTSSFRG
jgi:L-fuculose-phosphate aldolase